MPLAKVWANSVGGQNPKWPLSAILNSVFFTDLANPVFQYIISGVLRGEKYIPDIMSMMFSCFKSKMAAVSDLENQFSLVSKS